MRSEMLSLMLLTGVAFALTLSTFAADEVESDTKEQTVNAEELGAVLTEHLVEPLGLSEEQANQVRPVLVEEVVRLQGIFERHRGGVDEDAVSSLKEEIEASQAATRAALEPILTTEQLASLGKVQKERRAEIGGELIVHRLQDQLDLTAEQREQLVPIFAEDLSRRREIMMQARDHGSGREVMKAVSKDMRDVQMALEEQLESILNEEQFAAYQDYQAAMRMQVRDRLFRKGKGAAKGQPPRD